MDAAYWKDFLRLQPHPEGGHYRETYRSDGIAKLDAKPHPVSRNYCTAIYFLLEGDEFSAYHRITSDEVWHFYGGNTLELLEINPEGLLRRTLIGNNPMSDEVPQYIVQAGNWFASRVLGGHGFVLVGCTVSPGFDFQDFEMAQRDALLQAYPQHRQSIMELTRLG